MRLAFVTPRWGPGVLGGSEAVMAEAAAGLAPRGHEVDVLTTCALDHYTWENELPEGISEEKGVRVRRFLVDRRPSRAALAAQISVQAGRVPDLDHQVSWLGFQFATPGLFEHVAREGTSYDALVFSPYLFWNTTACLPLVADRAVLVPCLHDETYARLDIVRPVLAVPALVWFLSGPEHELAHTLGPVSRCHSVTGAGVPVPRRYDPEGFRERQGLRRPFVLYAGRREGGKGLPWLLEAFASAAAADGQPERPPGEAQDVEGTSGGLRDLDLVIIGKGDPAATLRVPPELAGRVFDLGYLDDAERDNAFAAAFAYLQPSSVESFSRTAMEAWLAGRPVVALASNAVLAWHCRRSGGGLLVSDAPSLREALGQLTSDPALASELGRTGRRYVLENYTWDNVLDRMEASLQALPESRVGPRGGAAPAATGAAGGDTPAATGAASGEAPAGTAAPVSTAGPASPCGPRSRRYLVAGSYPPLPGAPSAATLAAVRRAWAEGAEAVVAAPRPSAAKHTLASHRPLGRQLAALGRREGCDGVVLCIEPGWPLRAGRSRAPGLRSGRGLADAMLGFAHAEVVVTGTPRDLALQLDALAPLWAAVHQVTASNGPLALELATLATLAGRPPLAPAVRVLEPFAGAGFPPAPPSCTAPGAGSGLLPPLPGCPGPLEPGELLLTTRARRLLGRVARRVLGRHAPAVRGRMEELLRRGRPRV